MTATTTANADEVTLPGRAELDAIWPAPEEPAEGVDDEAPYGRKADGTPKAKPGRPPKPRANAAGPKVPPSPPRRPSSRTARKAAAGGSRKATAAAKESPYKAAVAGPLQMLGVALTVAGAQTGSPALCADAYAIAEHTEPLSQAIADLADQDARIAAVLDRLAQVGPYGALIGAMIPLVMQLAANHGSGAMVTFGAPFGVRPPQELLNMAMADAAMSSAIWAAEQQEAANIADAEFAAAEQD